MSDKIDLHTHTTHSDGSLTPREIVAEAAANGVAVLSITDHDCVGAIPEAAEACGEAGITFVPGVELTAYHEGREIHVLAYFIDLSQTWLTDLLDEFQAFRMERMRRMLDRLEGLGISISMDDVRAQIDGSIGRPHLARALVAKGHCADISEVFQRFLGPDGPAHEPKQEVSLQESIDIVKRAKGISIIAHPGLSVSNNHILLAKGLGLDGIETYHCDHTPRQIRHYEAMAREHDLVMTGGSDFHGGRIRQHSTVGGTDLPADTYLKMLDRLNGSRSS